MSLVSHLSSFSLSLSLSPSLSLALRRRRRLSTPGNSTRRSVNPYQDFYLKAKVSFQALYLKAKARIWP